MLLILKHHLWHSFFTKTLQVGGGGASWTSITSLSLTVNTSRTIILSSVFYDWSQPRLQV